MAPNPAFFTGMVGAPVYSPAYLARSFQEAQDRANAANEKRYQDALAEFQRLRRNMIAGANAQGNAQITDINRAYQDQAGGVMQNLASRGLMSSTVAPTMMGGMQRDKLQALGRLRESLAAQRMQADQMGTDRIVGLMQSKYDNGPDPGLLAGMMQNYGASGAGSAYPPPSPAMGPDPMMAMLQQMADQQSPQQMGPSPMQPMGMDRAQMNRMWHSMQKYQSQQRAIGRRAKQGPAQPGTSPWAWWDRPKPNAPAPAPTVPAAWKPSGDYLRAATQPGMFRWTPWSFQTQGWNKVPR